MSSPIQLNGLFYFILFPLIFITAFTVFLILRWCNKTCNNETLFNEGQTSPDTQRLQPGLGFQSVATTSDYNVEGGVTYGFRPDLYTNKSSVPPQISPPGASQQRQPLNDDFKESDQNNGDNKTLPPSYSEAMLEHHDK